MLTMGGIQSRGPCGEALSSEVSSVFNCFAPGRSALLMTNTSAISMTPAFMVWISSPMPGTSTTTMLCAW